MKKEPERNRQIKSDFAEAFIHIAQTKSLEKIRVYDIVEKSGYSRSSFYRHFKNLNSLQDFIGRFIRPNLYWKPKDIQKDYWGDDIAKAIQYCREFLENNIEKLKLSRTPELKKQFENVFTNIVSDSYMKIKDKLNEKDNERLKFIVMYHVKGSFQMFWEYANSYSSLSIEEMSVLFAEMHYYGIFVMRNRLKKIK